MAINITDKVALVTGGAKGLGAATCRVLAAEGATVLIADVDETAGAELEQQLRAAGGKACFMHLDVSDPDAWQRVMERVSQLHGRLNVLVNNAGIAPVGDMEMPFETWRQVMSINLDGTFLGTQAAIRTMRQTGSVGSIINISSTMAMVAEPTTAAYSASKGGVRSLTKAAAIYCGVQRLPIRVNSVHPGMCLTPLVQGYFAQFPEQRQQHEAKYPIGHLGEAEDVAYSVLYLASDESKFVTGTELVVDGGYLAKG